MAGKGGLSGGARKGAGRPKGKPNRATIERAKLAERILEQAAGKSGRKLGREILEDFAIMFGGLAAAFQPQPSVPGAPMGEQDMERWAKSYKEPLFEKYAKLAAKCANDFADFESPRLGRIQVAAPPPDSRGPLKKKFSVGIFDGSGRKAPQHIDVKANSSVIKSNGANGSVPHSVTSTAKN